MIVNMERRREFEMDGEKLKRVEEFDYLGARVTRRGGTREDIIRRI